MWSGIYLVRKQSGISNALRKTMKAAKTFLVCNPVILVGSCNYSRDGIVSGCLNATLYTNEL